MPSHNDVRRLRHMLDHAREAVAFANGRSLDDMLTDRQLELILVRLVEVIGEAANRVSTDMQSKHPDIAWRMMIDTRNRLIHGYDKLSLPLVWSIVQHNLPPLIEQLESILAGDPRASQGDGPTAPRDSQK